MAVTKFTTTQVGTTTQYTVTFEVINAADIDVYVDGVLQLQQNTTSTAAADHPQVISGEITQGTALINYTVASNNGSITFNQAPTVGAFLVIERTTADAAAATFVAGSTIRAQDLNNAFDQVRFLSQEAVYTASENVIRSKDNGDSFDAINQRIQNLANGVNDSDAVNRGQLGKVITDDLIEGEGIDLTDVSGGTNSGKQVTISAELSTPTNPGVVKVNATTPIIANYAADGDLELSIAANSIDLDRIKNDDIVTLAEQNAGASWNSDDQIPTTAASSKRHDCLVQTSTPVGSDWQVGKMWMQNDSDRTVYIWDGSIWLPIASGGAFTTLPKVVYVDAINGDDNYEAHRLSNPKKTIKSAIDQINADAAGDGSIVVVAPGVYGEEFPIDIQKNDIAIVGSSLRNCIIHPAIPAADQAGYDVNVPEANELQIMFRVNSGSYFYGLTLQGMKASGTRGGNALDTDTTYGLPTNQGWNFAFYPGATIKKSPYIQNCTNFSDSQINNVNFTPRVPGEGAAGDLDSGFAGGGILIDGSVPASNSPLRSMVCDSYTHTALNGPGIFVTNNGYCQATSSYSFFNHFHLKTKNGGQANLAASTTDFGNYSLIADGRSTNAIFTAATTATASANDTTFTIGAPTVGPDWHGSATRPQDNMLVDIGGNTYPVLSAVAAGSGWTVTISRPDPTNLSQNLGLQNNVASGASANFYLRSMIASSGHTMEYVGSGTDYRALPENGGVPIEARQKTELNNGKIWAAITDHKGKFIVGDTFSVDQQTGFINTGSGSFAIPRLIVDLDLNGNTISDSTGNVVIDDTLSMNSNKIVNVTDPTAAQDAATKAYVDALETSLEGGQLDNLYFRQDTGETINSGDTWSSSDLSIATTAAIDARIVDLVDDVGGFVPINDENSFPATNPDINDGAGTLISIQEISTSRTPSGGTVTIANGSGSNTVTINNCGTTVLASGYGCIVETTTTLHTYNFHRLTPLATEVSTVAANVTPINTVATNISDVTTVSTDIASVVTVANDLNEPVSEIDTVATNITNVNNVGNNISDVTTVSGSISNVNTVASDITNVNNTGTYIANVNTVAGQISPTNNVATVAGVASDIPTVAGISSNVTTVAGISSNVTTVAGISGNVTTVAGISSDVTAVANNNTDVSTVATNITDVNTFANRYRIASSDPTTSLDTGDLVFNTTSNELRVYNGTSWQGGVTATGNLVSKSGDTMTGDLSFGGTQKVTNLATPTATGDAATKGYVDTAVAGAPAGTSTVGTGSLKSNLNNELANRTTGDYNIALGYDALDSVTSSSNQIGIGYQALAGVTAGAQPNIGIGRDAGLGITEGDQNIFIGDQCGKNVTLNGAYNTLVGNNIKNSNNGNCSNNNIFGYQAGTNLSSGHSNCMMGVNTALSATTAASNVLLGNGAAQSLTTGANNTIIGTSTGSSSTTVTGTTVLGYSTTGGQGSYGLMLGYSAGNSNITGSYNIGLGYSAHGSLTSGTFNTAIGYNATATSGQYNVLIGREVQVGSGINNVLLGNNAGSTNITGSNNIGLGTDAIAALTSGSYNVCLGYYAGRSINTGAGNVILGYMQGGAQPTTGSYNTVLGYQAGNGITTGSNNVVLGNGADPSAAGISNEITLGNTSITKFRVPGINFILKDNASLPTAGKVLLADSSGEGYWGTFTGDPGAGSNNVVLGSWAGNGITSAGESVFVGVNAGRNVTTYGSTVAIGYSAGRYSGASSVWVGYEAGNANGNNRFSVGVGRQALLSATAGNNTAVGYEAGRLVSTGTNNIMLGYQAGNAITTGANNIVIGYDADATSATTSNEITLGNNSITKFRVPGINFILKDNGGTPSSGQVLTADASGEGYWAAGGATNINGLSDGFSYSASSYGLGSNALASLTTGPGNIAFGTQAGLNLTTAVGSIALGYQALATATTQSGNTAVGYQALKGCTNTYNTALGYEALTSCAAGYSNVAAGYNTLNNLSSGYENVAAGVSAGTAITTGIRNTLIGRTSGSTLTTGANNIVIGYSAQPSSATVSNEATIGNTSITKFRVPGVDFVVEGHAWVNFQGTGTVSIFDSNNVSSVTDNGTGDYTVNFTNSFPNASYAWALNARNNDNNASSQSFVGVTANCETPSTSSFRMSAVTPVNNTKQDHKYIVGQFFH